MLNAARKRRKNVLQRNSPEAGTIVEEDQAYQYALERCLHGTLEEQKEFREALVEWYYSGNWDEIEEET